MAQNIVVAVIASSLIKSNLRIEDSDVSCSVPKNVFILLDKLFNLYVSDKKKNCSTGLRFATNKKIVTIQWASF